MRQERRTCGSVLSSTSTSLEKRFNTRPSGVVSNSSIGQCKTYRNSSTCISRAAASAPNANDREQAKLAITGENGKVFGVDL